MKYDSSIRLKNAALIISMFTAISLVSVDFAICLFFCFIFLMTLSNPRVLEIPTIFAVSVLLDLCALQFVGILFVQYMVIYLFASSFRSILLNSKIFSGWYFFGALFCFSELIGIVVTAASGGNISFRHHLIRLMITMTQCCLCLLIAFILRKIRDKYAT